MVPTMIRSLLGTAALAAAGATATMPTHPVAGGLLLAIGAVAAAGASRATVARRPVPAYVPVRRRP